ncbi:hypothetical protein NQZ68_023033 [Dissostichus eleginoides]|uniref:Non-structural protein 1 n=1 Tax=Dissostichus eleginoides TaxID=100907 RepID=A0AAD9FGN8_DISEL|nr:hypothetical protein NQZ68_023033 [Dissostichus eleginoides]KAK1905298.1 Non-structural protein 1 [Dissostichus eleginoides]
MWVSINSSTLAGWELPPMRLAEFHSKCPLASHTVTSEACFLDPTHKKKIKSPKNKENILLFHIWKTEGPGATGAAGLRDHVLLDPSRPNP